MKPTTKEPKKTISGELALLVAVMINSFGVVLMLYSKAGISAISSVPYAFSLAWPKLSLGTWTYLFQATLIISLMIMRKKFVLNYLFSFAVGFVFSEFLDLHELWIGILPTRTGMAGSLFRNQLPATLHWNCHFQPLWPSNCAD